MPARLTTSDLGRTFKGTWLSRPGETASTSKGVGRRWVLHRWTDTGETDLREIEGDGRTTDFRELRSFDLGTTADFDEARRKASDIR